VTEGALRAVMLKWGTCPTEGDIDTTTGSCLGFCELEWLGTRGIYSGVLYNTSAAHVAIPYGFAEAPDKRRRGSWYVGVVALPELSAQFELLTTLYEPPRVEFIRGVCDRLGFCAADPSRLAWQTAAPPPPPPAPEGVDMGMIERSKALVSKAVPPAAFVVGLGSILFVTRFLIQRRKRRRPLRV